MKLKDILTKVKKSMLPITETSTETNGTTDTVKVTTDNSNMVSKPKPKRSKLAKSNSSTAKSQVKNRKSKMVLNEDLDKAIRAAKNRLYYLEMRKKNGKPVSGGAKVAKNKAVLTASKDFFWYQREVKDSDFISKYKNLNNEFRKAAGAFANYMLKLDDVLRKYGTEAEWSAFQSLLKANNPLSEKEEKALDEIFK